MHCDCLYISFVDPLAYNYLTTDIFEIMNGLRFDLAKYAHDIFSIMIFAIPTILDVVISVLPSCWSAPKLQANGFWRPNFSDNDKPPAKASNEAVSDESVEKMMQIFFELLTTQKSCARFMNSVIFHFKQRRKLASHISIESSLEDVDYWLPDSEKKEGFIFALKNYINHLMITPL